MHWFHPVRLNNCFLLLTVQYSIIPSFRRVKDTNHRILLGYINIVYICKLELLSFFSLLLYLSSYSFLSFFYVWVMALILYLTKECLFLIRFNDMIIQPLNFYNLSRSHFRRFYIDIEYSNMFYFILHHSWIFDSSRLHKKQDWLRYAKSLLKIKSKVIGKVNT